MASRLITAAALLIFLLFPLGAQSLPNDKQQPGDAQPAGAVTQPGTVTPPAAAEDYSFELQEDGAPLFIQRISWEEVRYVLEYELEILDSAGSEIYRGRSAVPEQTVSLPAGGYRYRITLFNLLAQPEITGEWQDLLIKKAELPRLSGFAPETLYLEEERFTLNLDGRDLLPDARVVLVDPVLGLVRYEASIVESDNLRRLQVLLPAERLDSGDFKVKVINPGGLYDIRPEILRVRYQNPVELFGQAAVAPYIPLFDSWYTANWSEPVYPASARGSVSFMFIKKRYGYYGVEASGAYRYTLGGFGDTAIHTTVSKVALSAVFKYRPFERFFILTRVGGGSSWTAMEFQYGSVIGISHTTRDPLVSAGLAFQLMLSKHFFAELGAEFETIFYDGFAAGAIMPGLSAGYIF